MKDGEAPSVPCEGAGKRGTSGNTRPSEALGVVDEPGIDGERVEIEKEGNCHPNPRGGPWAYSKSHQNTHHVTMGRMGTASNRPESLPSGMDSIFPASQLPKAPSGSHGMDPQKTTDEEDAGVEKLERSVQSSTPEGSPWRLPENLHASLAQFGQSFAESSSAQQLIHGDWPFGPNEVQGWDCVAVL